MCDARQTAAVGQKGESNKWLQWLLISFALAGLGAALLPVAEPLSNPATLVHMLVVGLLTFGWVRAHARELGVVAPAGAALLAGAVPLLGVPVYLLRIHGAIPGGIASLKALGFYVVCGLAYVATHAIAALALAM